MKDINFHKVSPEEWKSAIQDGFAYKTNDLWYQLSTYTHTNSKDTCASQQLRDFIEYIQGRQILGNLDILPNLYHGLAKFFPEYLEDIHNNYDKKWDLGLTTHIILHAQTDIQEVFQLQKKIKERIKGYEETIPGTVQHIADQKKLDSIPYVSRMINGYLENILNKTP